MASHDVISNVILSDSRRQGETIIPINNTIYEFTPLEFGSWNPDLRAFIPVSQAPLRSPFDLAHVIGYVPVAD
jgi:lysophospholipase